MSSSKNSISRMINSGKETLGNIGKTRAIFMAAVLNALVGCNSWDGDSSSVEKPQDAIQKVNAQLGSVSKNVVEIEITDSNGTNHTIPQNQFTKSYIESLPEWDFSYSVVLDGFTTKIQWLDSNKTQILSQYANEITDYIKENNLNSDGIRKFLKEISLPDLNGDNAVDEKDITLSLPADFSAPQFLKDYCNLLENWATESEKVELIKTEFTQKNIVSTIETSDNSTGEISIILKPSSANRVIRYEIVSTDVQTSSRSFMAAYAQSNQELIQWQEVKLQPGEKVIYSEYDPVLDVESAKKEIKNELHKPQLKVSAFDLLEDGKINGQLETQYDAVTNFTITDTSTKGLFTLNSDGTFEYTGWADQFWTDTVQVSFESAGKTYTTQIQFNIESVNDIPESKNANLGTLDFGQTRTLSVNDIAQDKDGDTLQILMASTTNGSAISLNSDGTITFTADTEGQWQIIAMVTDNKSDAVSIQINYNVKAKIIDKSLLITTLDNYRNDYDNGTSLYTPSSYASFKAAYETAVTTLNNDGATKEDVNSVINDLNNTKNALVALSNKSELNEAIHFAEAVSDTQYTAPTFASMLAVLAEAKLVQSNWNSTPAEVLVATTKLNDSIDDLVDIATTANISALTSEINIVKALNSSSYTNASFTALETALSAAESGITSHQQKLLSDSEARALKQNLVNAKNGLILKNRAPSSTTILNITENEGVSINLDLSGNFSDLDGDSLTYSQSGLPSGLTLNSSTGKLTWTLAEVTTNKSYNVTVTATDGELTASENFVIYVNNVNNAPEVKDIPTLNIEEWKTLSLILSNYFSDKDGQNLTFSSTAGSISNGIFTFNAPEVTDNTPETITISATDWEESVSKTFTINVLNINKSPESVTISNKIINEGDTLNITLSDYFSDPDNQNLTYSSNLGTITNGIFNFNASEVTTNTDYTVTITGSDWALTTSKSFTITVNNVNNAPTVSTIPTQTVNEGNTVTLTLSDYFSDADNQNLVFSSNLGTITNWVFSFTAQEVNANSTETITISATDWEASVSETFFINIKDVNKAPTGTNIADVSGTEGTNFNKDISSNFNDLDNNTLTFTANGLPNTLSMDSNTGIISGTLPGVDLTTPYSVTIFASDWNLSTSKSFTLTVNHINQAPTANYDFVSPEINEGLTLRYDLNNLFNDVDSNLTFTIAENNATVVWNEIVFNTPNVPYNSNFFFTVTASDWEFTATNYLDVNVKSVISSAPTEAPLLKESNFFYSVTTSNDPNTWNPVETTKKYYNGDKNTYLSWDHIEDSNGYEYMINSWSWIDLNNRGSINISELGLWNGDYSMKVRAKNDLGNGPESLVTDFTIDTTRHRNLISDVLFDKCTPITKDGINYLDCNVIYDVLDAGNLYKYNIQLDYAGKSPSYDTPDTQKNFLFPINELTPYEIIEITIKTYSHNGKLSYTNNLTYQYTGNE